MLRRLLSRTLSLGASPFRIAATGADTSYRYAVIAVLVPTFFFLYDLGGFPLRDNNEGLYAEIAREMLASGQFVVPHLNGVPYIEKPPLLYWLTGTVMWWLGPTASAARLASAASMLALCLCLFQFCRLHSNPRAGCYASVALASAVPVALISHVLLFDPLLTALLGACLLAYLHSYLTRRRRPVLLAAVLLALAVLEKGALALVLAGGIVGFFLLLMRERSAWRRLLDPVALAILLLVAGPWHLLAALQQDGFSWFYFVNEHLLRFLGRREPYDYHTGPVWYYLPRLPLMMLPWTPFLALLWDAPGAPQPANRTIRRFCLAAVAFPLAFFSLSQAKAEYYLLVAAPALALWLALEVAPRAQSGDRRLAWCWGMSAASVILMLAAAPGTAGGAWRIAPVLLVLAWAVLTPLAVRWFARLRSLRARELALLGIALVAAPVLALLCRAAEMRSVRDSSRDIARIILAQSYVPQVLVYRDFEDVFSTLPFYLRRPVGVIDSASRDLQFGCSTAAQRVCLSVAQFQRMRAAGPVAVAVHSSRVTAFLEMAGAQGWRIERAGAKLVFFAEPEAQVARGQVAY